MSRETIQELALAFPKVRAASLREIQVGESRVMIERDGTRNPGASVTSYASREAGMKFFTRSVFIVDPITCETVKALVVTRLPETSNE